MQPVGFIKYFLIFAIAVSYSIGFLLHKDELKLQKIKEVTYVGAVLEYEAYGLWTDESGGVGVITHNAKAIIEYVNEAKLQNADIFVAPEYGLQSLEMVRNDTEKFLTYTQYIPNPSLRICPCTLQDNISHLDAMRILSCGAISNQMYLVIDVAELAPCTGSFDSEAPLWAIELSEDCPETGFFAYNTQVVFDRNGVVIARYRKIHLFLEPFFTPGPLDDKSAVFVTDFDVTFSLQICFDIVYEHPGYTNVKYNGIRDVAMSTAWVDELPFHLADEIQDGWSRGLHTNLLVAGYHKPSKTKLGSGIFKGYKQEFPTYTYNKDSGNVLLVSNVTTIASSNLVKINEKIPLPTHLKKAPVYDKEKVHNYVENPSKPTVHTMLHEDLTNYTAKILQSGNSSEVQKARACSNDSFCCFLSYEYTGNLTYMLLAYSGKITEGYGSYKIGTQICGIVWCRNSDKSSCAMVKLNPPQADSFGPFHLSAFHVVADTVFPGGIRTDLTLITNDELHFKKINSGYSLHTNSPVSNPLSMALFGRWFILDSE